MRAPNGVTPGKLRVRKVASPEGNMADHAGWSAAARLLSVSLKLDVLALLRQCDVREALEALASKTGVRRIELLVWAAVAVHKPEGRVYWERLYASETGKSWKALTTFPERIRKMAKELEALDRNSYFRGETPELPSLCSRLNDRADQIRAQIENIPFLEERPRHRGQSPWKSHLSRRIQALTGRFYDAEAARLINAVDAALNGDKASVKGVDAQALADLRFRRKHESSKT